MVEKICDILMERVKAKMPEVNEERAEIIRYGFELIIGEIPKMIFIFILALVLGKFKYFLISLAIICPYRTFSGGMHLKTHIGCFITTTTLYLGSVYFCEFFNFNGDVPKFITIICVYIFSFAMVILYAPADTDTVPILIKKDRQLCKIKSILWITGILVAALFIKDNIISNLCIFGILFQTLTITKLTYKLFRVKLGYLEYKKSL